MRGCLTARVTLQKLTSERARVQATRFFVYVSCSTGFGARGCECPAFLASRSCSFIRQRQYSCQWTLFPMNRYAGTFLEIQFGFTPMASASSPRVSAGSGSRGNGSCSYSSFVIVSPSAHSFRFVSSNAMVRSMFRVTVVVGKPYDSSKHPAASMLLNEILGRSDWHRAQRCGEVAIGGRANFINTGPG